MPDPELWTRCPCPGGTNRKISPCRVAHRPDGSHYGHKGGGWGAPCSRCEGTNLVRVPFDEAVERMRRLTAGWSESGYWASALNDEDAAALLRAALGEEKP